MSYEDLDGFGSDLLILGEDGDDAHVVPMGEPYEVKDRFRNDKAGWLMVVCGGHEILDPVDWTCKERQMGSTEYAQVKKLAQGREGKVMLMLHRSGAKNSLDTRYRVTEVSELDKAKTAACQALAAEFHKE